MQTWINGQGDQEEEITGTEQKNAEKAFSWGKISSSKDGSRGPMSVPQGEKGTNGGELEMKHRTERENIF